MGNSRAGVAIAVNARQVRRGDLPRGQPLPVDLSKPRMREHVAGAVPQIAVPARGVAFHQLHDDVRRVLVELRGEADKRRPARDALVQQHVVDLGLVVRREPGEHLEDEHAEGVPVDAFVVPLLQDNLGDTLISSCILMMRMMGLITSGAR